MLRPSLKDFEHNPTSMENECNCMVVWTFFSTAVLCYWDENWPFPVLWPLLSFPILLAYWVQRFHSIISLFSSISSLWSRRKAFLSLRAILWKAAFIWAYLPLSPFLSFLFFSQLFVRPPQITTLPSCISFSWGWFWSPPSVQCYVPLSIFLQALCLTDLVP